jgi:dihydropyrimidinase
MSKTLIKNGWITTASDLFRGDILNEKGKIKEVGLELKAEADLVIDGTDRYVFPGGIDAHVHMDVLCADGSVSTGYDTDSIASAVGGTTTMLHYVMQEKGQTLGETVMS